MQDFETFFQTATGHGPHGYQARIARDGLSDLVATPTGTGKTGVVLAWLWRRLHGPDPAGTPRRLIYALPQRSLADQVAGRLREWLAALGLTDEVALHVALGSRWQTQGDWRDDMHRPAIVVGPADVLVSKALVRGFDLSRALFPIDFALVGNGAHWIIDESELGRQTTATLRQLAGLAAQLGTAEPFGLTCLSSLAPVGHRPTPDNPEVQNIIQIREVERTGVLATRLAAARAVRRLAPAEPGDQQAIAALVSERHRPGTLTLVVMNTVDAARGVYQQPRLRSGSAGCALLHARFRGVERERLMSAVAGAGGRIVVTTQVIEAGLDLDAAVLVTEAAPWSALLLRAGHANRAGLRNADAELWWLPPAEPFPYQQRDVDATVAALGRLEGRRLTAEDLLARPVPVPAPAGPISLITRAELAGLFDTSPDPSGDEVDISRYVRDTDDLDAEVAWATWTASEDGAPDPEVRPPAAEFRCRVSPGEVIALARDRVVWRFDRLAGAWAPVTGWTSVAQRSQPGLRLQPGLGLGPGPGLRLQPGEVLLVNAADGGYDPETGLDPSARGPVADSPELLTSAERAELAELAAAELAAAELAEAGRAAELAGREAVAGAEGMDAAAVDSEEPRRWQSVDEHSRRVRDQAAALLAVLAPAVSPEAARSAVVAAYLHDLGKAHEIWQDAICALAEDEEQAEIAAGRPWAKSGGRGGALLFADGVAFRHELASLLLIDGPLSALLAESPDPDLTRYLVLAHHGKLRVQVREADGAAFAPAGQPLPGQPWPGEPSPGQPPGNAIRGLRLGQPSPSPAPESANGIRGLRPGATTAIPAMLGQPATTLTVDLGQFKPGGDRSWTRTVLGLRDKYGPFILAYLETVVRVADWRASGGMELPGGRDLPGG